MARLFGTDGVRGVANSELTPDLAFKLGRAAALYFGRETKHPKLLLDVIPDFPAACWKQLWRPAFVAPVVMPIFWE